MTITQIDTKRYLLVNEVTRGKPDNSIPEKSVWDILEEYGIKYDTELLECLESSPVAVKRRKKQAAKSERLWELEQEIKKLKDSDL